MTWWTMINSIALSLFVIYFRSCLIWRLAAKKGKSLGRQTRSLLPFISSFFLSVGSRDGDDVKIIPSPVFLQRKIQLVDVHINIQHVDDLTKLCKIGRSIETCFVQVGVMTVEAN